MKILFLHGLDSKPYQDRIDMLSSYGELEMPFIDYRSEKNVFDRIDKLTKEFNPDIIIGHSMGGVVAYYLSNKYKIPALLFMPAFSSKNKHFINMPADVESYPKYDKQTVIIAEEDDVIDNQITKTMFNDADIKSEAIGHNLPPYILEKWFKRVTGINEMITNIKQFNNYIQKITEHTSANKHIGDVDKKINVSFAVELTDHAITQTKRDINKKMNDVVTEPEIMSVINDASYDIIDAILYNKINIGDRIVVTKTFNYLNIVIDVRLINNVLTLVVITVIRTSKFYNTENSYIIKV